MSVVVVAAVSVISLALGLSLSFLSLKAVLSLLKARD